MTSSDYTMTDTILQAKGIIHHSGETTGVGGNNFNV